MYHCRSRGAFGYNLRRDNEGSVDKSNSIKMPNFTYPRGIRRSSPPYKAMRCIAAGWNVGEGGVGMNMT